MYGLEIIQIIELDGKQFPEIRVDILAGIINLEIQLDQT